MSVVIIFFQPLFVLCWRRLLENATERVRFVVLRLSGLERSTMRCEGLGRDAVDWCRKRCPHQGLRAKVPGVIRCHNGEEWGKTDKTDDRRICK